MPDYMSWVAPVGRTASRTPHFRSTALETSTPAEPSQKSHPGTDRHRRGRHQTVPSGRASHRPTVGRAASPALIILIVIVAILPLVSNRLRHKVLANLVVDIRLVSLA